MKLDITWKELTLQEALEKLQYCDKLEKQIDFEVGCFEREASHFVETLDYKIIVIASKRDMNDNIYPPRFFISNEQFEEVLGA